MDHDHTNIEFQQALDFVNYTDRHIFLTGKAGSGKTTFLKSIRQGGAKNLVILAPTGVAAVNAGGTTIHSFFQLPFGLFLPVSSAPSVTGNYLDKDSLVKNINFNAAKKELLREIDTIVIDEVSMVRADLLDAIDAILRFTRNIHDIPFGGVQMIFLGDLFQLPPVVKTEEWNCLRQYYDTPFFFSALALKKMPPLQIVLKKIYRQTDTSFIQLLNNIRENRCSDTDFSMLNIKYSPSVNGAQNNHIFLTTHNAKVDKTNKQKLTSLPGGEIIFEAMITGEFPDKNYPAEKTLRLKTGAQVMLIKNDTGDNRKYFNGKVGTVDKIEPQSLHIRFPDDSVLIIERETWTNIKYRFDQGKGKVEQDDLGTFKQLPVRLAWAITIHKSQGLTFENAIIDASESFSPGQVYVALSRLTSLEGLVLSSPIFPDAVTADQRILEYSRQYSASEILQQTLQTEQLSFLFKKILRCFDFTKDTDAIQLYPNKYVDYNLLQEAFQKIVQHREIAGKFLSQLSSIYTSGNPSDRVKVAERTHSGVKFFTNELDQITGKLTELLVSIKTKKSTKEYASDLKSLLTLLEVRKTKMMMAVVIADGFAHNEVPSVIHQKLNKTTKKVPELPENAPRKRQETHLSATEDITLQLYNAGHAMEKIAKKRKMAVTTVEIHLLKAIQSGQLPVSALIRPEKLEKIYGILTVENCEFPAAIRQQLGTGFTYTEIRAAIAHWKLKNIND